MESSCTNSSRTSRSWFSRQRRVSREREEGRPARTVVAERTRNRIAFIFVLALIAAPSHVSGMKHFRRNLLMTLSLLAASFAFADDKPRVSPHETITAEIDGSDVTIVYGRPY